MSKLKKETKVKVKPKEKSKHDFPMDKIIDALSSEASSLLILADYEKKTDDVQALTPLANEVHERFVRVIQEESEKLGIVARLKTIIIID